MTGAAERRLIRIEDRLRHRAPPPVPPFSVDPCRLTPEEMAETGRIRALMDRGGLSTPDLALADRLRAKLNGVEGAM